MQEKKKSQSNQSSEKMFSIIELLASEHEPMRLLDISRRLGISTSTVSRFLATLISCGYAAQDEDTLKYYLTFKICAIANKVSANSNVRDVAAPYLRQLSKVFGESACLAVEQDMKVVYIDAVEGPDQMIRSMQRIGNVAPMYCTGIGKLFLLDYTEQKLDHLIQQTGLRRLTDNTLTSKEQLVEELERIRRRGYSFDNEECEVGARCIACPILDHTGKMVAGISITGPVARLTDSFIERRLDYLLKASQEISKKLGYEGASLVS